MPHLNQNQRYARRKAAGLKPGAMRGGTNAQTRQRLRSVSILSPEENERRANRRLRDATSAFLEPPASFEGNVEQRLDRLHITNGRERKQIIAACEARRKKIPKKLRSRLRPNDKCQKQFFCQPFYQKG